MYDQNKPYKAVLAEVVSQLTNPGENKQQSKRYATKPQVEQEAVPGEIEAANEKIDTATGVREKRAYPIKPKENIRIMHNRI